MLKKYAFSWLAASVLLAFGASAWAGDETVVEKTAPVDAAAIEMGETDCVETPCDPCAPTSCAPCEPICCDPCPTVCCPTQTYCRSWNDCGYSRCGFRKHGKFRRGWDCGYNGGWNGYCGSSCGYDVCDPCGSVGSCDPCDPTCCCATVYCAPARKHCLGKRHCGRRAWRSNCAVTCYSSVNYCGYSSCCGCF